jgi:hypothetical protein
MTKLPPAAYVAAVLVLGAGSYFGYQTVHHTPAIAQPVLSANPAVSGHSAEQVAAVFKALSPELQARYKPLADDLGANKWERANEDTTEALLQAVGPHAVATGAATAADLAAAPAADFHAVDDLWQAGSHGRWGFTPQATVLHNQMAHDWKATYHKLGWDEIQMSYAVTAHRYVFAPGHAPDWDDLHTGELPTFERCYNHGVSLDAKLAALGITGQAK